jgi:hypothetical protein
MTSRRCHKPKVAWTTGLMARRVLGWMVSNPGTALLLVLCYTKSCENLSSDLIYLYMGRTDPRW